MTDGKHTPGRAHDSSLIDRRVQRIVNARSVTVGLAATFVLLAVVGGFVITLVDPDNFPNLGLGVWWALQTVTTVGYGDVVPKTDAGRVVGGIVMVMGVAFIAFVTAGVTSTLIQRGESRAQEVERARDERNTQTLIDAVGETTQSLGRIEERLDRIESKLT
ncbi:MAG TPA: potassium channel family protein [Gaiellaceae bacterium]|nr:potassium channel family protein [Gaiellaceae bacterium]